MMSVVRRRLTATAAAVATFGALTGIATPASAVINPLVVIGVVKQLIGIYTDLKAAQSNPDDSAQKILSAIEAAKQEILQHVDGIATADVRSCARSAVIDLADFTSMTTDTRQAFARETTSCVTKAEALLGVLTDPAAIDAVGFSVNIVGPVALFARTATGLTAGLPELQQTLVNADRAVMQRLSPSCIGTPLWGDVVINDPRPQNQYSVEVAVTCTAYDGYQANGWTRLRLNFRKPAPPDSPTYAPTKSKAGERTSYAVADAVLKLLV